MRNTKLPRANTRPTTTRRMAAAEKFLRKERESAPLFSEQIAAEQPTPAERIDDYEQGWVEGWRRFRWREAQIWKACRKAIREAGEKGRAVAARWQTCPYPASACYLSCLCRQHGLDVGIIPADIWERTFDAT